MSEELKPCPFCGSPAELEQENYSMHYFCWCANENCGCADTHDYKDARLAIKAWNTRPIEDELRTALKKAMEILLTDDEEAKAELFLELKGYL